MDPTPVRADPCPFLLDGAPPFPPGTDPLAPADSAAPARTRAAANAEPCASTTRASGPPPIRPRGPGQSSHVDGVDDDNALARGRV